MRPTTGYLKLLGSRKQRFIGMKTFRRSLRLKVKWSEYLRLKIMRERSLRAPRRKITGLQQAPQRRSASPFTGLTSTGSNLRKA